MKDIEGERDMASGQQQFGVKRRKMKRQEQGNQPATSSVNQRFQSAKKLSRGQARKEQQGNQGKSLS